MQTSLAAQGKAGLAVVKSAYTVNGEVPAPNGACMNMLYQMGPFNGADPIDKFGVFDVKRTNDGLYADKVLVNGYKMQAAFEALNDAGVVTPYVALAKNRLDTDAAVYNETSPGFFPWMSFGNLPHNKQVYWGGAGVSSATTGYPGPAPVLAATGGSVGSVVPVPPSTGYTFDNGVRLTPAPQFTGTTVGGDLLLDSNDVLPNLSLFSVPLGPGNITTLNPSGAAYEAALSAGDVQEAVVQAGYGNLVRGLMPDPLPNTPTVPISGFNRAETQAAQPQYAVPPPQYVVPQQPQQYGAGMPSYAPASYAPASAYMPVSATKQQVSALAATGGEPTTPIGQAVASVATAASRAALGSPYVSGGMPNRGYSCSAAYRF